MRCAVLMTGSILIGMTASAWAGSRQTVTLPLEQMYVGTEHQGGRYTQTSYRPWRSNHPLPWTYPSTYPWTNPVTYNAGPGNTHPSHQERAAQQRNGHRWTGYPPRHLYIVDYNGYAPPYYFLPR